MVRSGANHWHFSNMRGVRSPSAYTHQRVSRRRICRISFLSVRRMSGSIMKCTLRPRDTAPARGPDAARSALLARRPLVVGLRALDDRRHVVGQEEAIADERDGGERNASEIILQARIALGDRLPSVAGPLAIGTRPRQRQVRSDLAREPFRSADLRLAIVPTGVGSQRDCDFRQSNAGAIVASLVHRRYQSDEGLADARRLLRDDPL